MAAAKKPNASPWLWLSLLLVVAAFVAFILFLDRGIVEQARLDGERRAQPPEQAQRNQPVFDFYRVLPDRKVEIPEPEIIESRKPAPGATAGKPAIRYILQAGSFQSRKDAERQKASLALLGLEARIDSARVGGGTYFRVVLGPFASDSDFAKAERRLIQNDIRFIRKTARN